MESDHKTPNYTGKAGEEQKLAEELKKSLDKEMEKSPDEINVRKVNSIIDLLNQLENRIAVEEISKEEFAEKYLSKQIGFPRFRSIFKVPKAAVIFAVVAIGLVVGNQITVKATSKDLFTYVKEKMYMIYFDTKNINGEATEQLRDSVDLSEISEKIYTSWEGVQEKEKIKLKIPTYIPGNLELQGIHIQRVTTEDFGISGQYLDGEYSIRILIRTTGERGKWTFAIDELDVFLEEKEINNLLVSFYQDEDEVQAMFQDEKFIYVIETNMGREILEKIVLGMR